MLLLLLLILLVLVLLLLLLRLLCSGPTRGYNNQFRVYNILTQKRAHIYRRELFFLIPDDHIGY